MGPFMCEQSVGETLHKEPTVGSAEGFIHAMEGNEVGVRWPVPFCHEGG
jgi:hypothetical protein